MKKYIEMDINKSLKNDLIQTAAFAGGLYYPFSDRYCLPLCHKKTACLPTPFLKKMPKRKELPYGQFSFQTYVLKYPLKNAAVKSGDISIASGSLTRQELIGNISSKPSAL